MKKRESVSKPNTQPRKFQNAGRNDAPTPEELSRLKYDREKATQASYMPQNGFNRPQHPSAMGAQNQIGSHGQARVEKSISRMCSDNWVNSFNFFWTTKWIVSFQVRMSGNVNSFFTI
ncbi:unnamed protein product [[Candida] boidinii]|nr:unnamed protein product [[Candida] boidinii]